MVRDKMTYLCKILVKHLSRFSASGQPVNRSESDISAKIIIFRTSSSFCSNRT